MSEPKDTTQVEYRVLDGHCFYRVGDDGSMWSSKPNGHNWKRLKLYRNRRGYLVFTLRTSGVCSRKYLHRLVLESFVGPAPAGMECRHLDGNPANNRLSNLCWGTKSENALDSIRHGTFVRPVFLGPPSRVSRNRGESHGSAKTCEEDVLEMRRLKAAGFCRRTIAARFGLHPQTVAKILTGKRWRHV
jgi:hypothetical protein